jgi:hypothetical protein
MHLQTALAAETHLAEGLTLKIIIIVEIIIRINRPVGK